MKKSAYVFVIIAAVMAAGSSHEAHAQTSTEVLNRAIAFHDPQDKWNDYSGKVDLMTAFPERDSGGETIEINTKDGSYSDFLHASNTTRGIKDGEYFLVVGGKDRTPNDAHIRDIKLLRNHHYSHFGLPMELKASGLVLDDKVEKVKFQGRDCMAITFRYDESKIKNDYYKDSEWTIYLDPVNYSMRGYKTAGSLNYYAVCSGILNVNELKIPICKTYFQSGDDSFWAVDLFTVADEQ